MGLGRLGGSNLPLATLNIHPITHFYKITKFDLAIKIAILTDLTPGGQRHSKLRPTELKLGLWV
jgi:hypothetical protein